MFRTARTIALLFLGTAFACQGEPIQVAGFSEATYNAALSTHRPGVVKDVLVKEGHLAKKGEQLIELRNQAEKLEVDRRKLIWESKAAVVASRKRVETVEKDFQATRNLFREAGTVSQDEMDRKELEFELAKAELDRLETVEQQEEIEYHQAVEQLDLSRVHAPVDGIITHVYAEQGEYASLQRPLLRLVNIDRCQFVCSLQAALIHRIKQDETLTVTFPRTDGDIQREARVLFISPLVDAASGLREVRLEFDNQDHRLSPGIKGYLLLERGE